MLFDPEIAAQADESGRHPNASSSNAAVPQYRAAPQVIDPRAKQRIRITRRDLENYGYTPDCPRCEQLRTGRINSDANHSEECRHRIYAEWEAHDDPKWEKAKQELGIETTGTGLLPQPMGNEIRGLEQLDRPQHSDQASSSRPQPNPNSNPVPTTRSGRMDDDDDLADKVEGTVDRDAYPEQAPEESTFGSMVEEVYDLFMGDEKEDDDAMISSLVLAGVDIEDARIFIARCNGTRRSPLFTRSMGVEL